MNVFGELKKAMFELIASTSPTPAATGRIYADITNPLSAIPKFFNGTSWRPMTLGQATAFITQNSGKSVTVDWSQGLNQEVTLTDSCVINFINPVAGSVHTLVVTSAAQGSLGAAKIYGYRFNMPDQDCRRQPYQPLGQLPNAGSNVYRWEYSPGIKPGFTDVPAAQNNPVAPGGAGAGIDITADGKFLLLAQSTTPFSTGYQLFDVEQQAQCPAGIRDVVASSAANNSPNSLIYSIDGRAAFIATITSPYLQGWFTDRGKPVGSAFTNPATLPAGFGQCVAMHPNNTFVGIGHATSPFMSIYPFTGTGFGTKLADPSTLPAGTVCAMEWSPMGDYLAISSQSAPYIQVYAFDQNAKTIGNAAANPTIGPTNGPGTGSGGRTLTWRPQGDFIAMSLPSPSPYVYVIPFNRTTGAFGTPVTWPALANSSICVEWTPDGQYLIIGCGTAPFLYVFDFSTGVPVAVTFDGSVPTSQVLTTRCHPSGEYFFAAVASSPFLVCYSLPQKIRNYLRLNA